MRSKKVDRRYPRFHCRRFDVRRKAFIDLGNVEAEVVVAFTEGGDNVEIAAMVVFDIAASPTRMIL